MRQAGGYMLAVRLTEEVETQLGQLAKMTGRSKSFYAREAISEYVEREAWQITETLEAIKEANAGDFATDEEMAALRKKWASYAG